ncbi:MAG: hypothetical protein KJZ93_29525, partial [Caldilineaceae bacterium]|nr:hypothetical protein [Caldilineaceae bacterium]
ERTASLYQQPVFAAGQTGGIAGYPCYRTVEETYTALAALATAQPDLAQWITIGGSWNQLNPGNGDGHDLRVLVLTNRTIPGPKPRFFLMGAIHAREMTTAELAARFAEALVNGYGHHPDATWLLDYTEVHILPITNPDGRKWAEQLLYWRKNTNRNDGCSNASPFISYYGVDLNRNSGFKWGQCEGQNCSSTAACRDTFRGSGPASEPETQAVESYIRSLFPDQRGPDDDDPAPDDASGLLISLHSYSELVLFPWGWRATPSPNHDQLQTLGNKFGYFNGYRVCQSGAPGCIYMTDGTTDDWAYGELGVAAFTFELGTAFFEACSYFEETIVRDNLPALRYAAKSARRPYQTPAGPDSIEVTATPARIVSGMPLTLTALADDTRYRSNNGIDEPTQPIAVARYTLDAPSWVTGTQTFVMTAIDGLFDGPVEEVGATVETTDWPVGRRLLLVESQDTTGQWGAPSSVFVDVLASPYGVSLSRTNITSTVAANSAYTATVVVSNTGIVSDTFAITSALDAPGWGIETPAQLGPLPALGNTLLVVRIEAPVSAIVGDQASAEITITSMTDPATTAAITVALVIGQPTAEEEADEPVLTRLHLPLVGSP